MIKEQYRQCRVGLIGLGLERYWSKFEVMRARLDFYMNDVCAAPWRVTVNLGPVDPPSAGLETAQSILEIGNTNSRHRFLLGCCGFAEARNANGPAHHRAGVLQRLANVLELEFRQAG